MGSFWGRLAGEGEVYSWLVGKWAFPAFELPICSALSLPGSSLLRDWPYLVPGLSGFQFQRADFCLAQNSKLCENNSHTLILRAFLCKHTAEFLALIIDQWCVAVHLEGKQCSLFFLAPHPFSHSASLGLHTATHSLLALCSHEELLDGPDPTPR